MKPAQDSSETVLDPEATRDDHLMTSRFYRLLRREVSEGNPGLTSAQQGQLQGHYPVMMRPQRYPPALVSTIYSQRRAPAVAALTTSHDPAILDAGCGFGSESFLFAATGARVLAVDRSQEQIDIARRRLPFFERHLGTSLDIDFQTADLDTYDPDRRDLSLTWFASVLAGICDQDSLLRRIFDATRPDGEIMITDMNLFNPLFLFQEWRRRRRSMQRSTEFARQANYLAMVQRRGRRGARYFSSNQDELIDDVQFFRAGTLAQLLRRVGFSPEPATFSGFIPPISASLRPEHLERLMARIPLLCRFGYFYLMRGRKPEASRYRPVGNGR